MQRIVTRIDKTSLHPFRLLSVLALAYLLAHLVPRQARWLRQGIGAVFTLMGQQGLVVFCFGIFLSFLGRLVLEQSDDWVMQLVLNVVGLGLLVAVAAVPAWYRGQTRMVTA